MISSLLRSWARRLFGAPNTKSRYHRRTKGPIVDVLASSAPLFLCEATCVRPASSPNRRCPVHHHPVVPRGLNGLQELCGIHGLLDVAVNSKLNQSRQYPSVPQTTLIRLLEWRGSAAWLSSHGGLPIRRSWVISNPTRPALAAVVAIGCCRLPGRRENPGPPRRHEPPQFDCSRDCSGASAVSFPSRADRPQPAESLSLHDLLCRTFIYLRFSPDAPTVLVNDSLHGGQSHASNFEVFLAVKTLKDAKQLGGILILKPTPLSRTKFTG